MTQTSSPECEVLVVGAGPTGLTLAAQLLARGIRTRIIDKGNGPAAQSRALGIHARALELLDTMGLADRFIEQGHQVRRLRMYAGKRNLVNLDLSRNGSRYGFVLHLPQSDTERLLRARVLELGGTIEQETEFVGFAQRSDVVEARLRGPAGDEIEVGTGYVVGCDGAHSKVRHELGLAFDGQPYAQDWLLADVVLDGAGSDDAVHLFFRPDGLPLSCIPLGGRRWRIVMANAGDRGGRQPTFAEIQDLVAQRAPRPITISDPEWLASFRCQLRSTSTYRRGRVFVAGDAAHIHSPAGGQGMNTGMMDAANLAWKLALVAGGHAAERLLDTYGQERIPVASGVIGLTDKLVSLLTIRNPVRRAVRDTVLPVATSMPAVQRHAARRLSQVSIGYPSSPLVQRDGGRRGPLPGERVPDVDVRAETGPTRLHALLRGGRHVLLVSCPEMVDGLGASGYAGLVDVVPGGVGAGDDFALVRPDGILAARGSRTEIGKVTDYLRQLCGGGAPQTPAPADAMAVAVS
jgi:2-polyprenyl-6-methoxyphenol hydroxylase-like FAD-dependent oxidoreductase